MFEPVTMTLSVSEIALPLASTGVVPDGGQDDSWPKAIDRIANRTAINKIISRCLESRALLRFASDPTPLKSEARTILSVIQRIRQWSRIDVEQKHGTCSTKTTSELTDSFLRPIPGTEDRCESDPRSDRGAATLE